MRRIVYSTLLFLLLSLSAVAQNEGINFQGMARNAAGEALANQKISLRLSVLLNSESGTVEYSETKEATTSGQGIFSIVVGDGSILTKTGNFSDINWKNSPKFLKVEMDPSGGTNFALLGSSRLQAVPFAYYANGVDAENIQGTLPITKGGTGVGSITALKTSLGIDQVSNTSDANKPISTAAQTALNTKVDKVTGKELSSNDFTTAEKNKLAAITGTNTGDQDLSGLATTAALAGKVDKVNGKELSSNDFTTAEKTKLAAISGTNTGDQDLSGLATTAALATKANTSDVTTGLAGKVDKVSGKELSSNDYSTAEKTKLAAISGTNTGDQDLSGLATTAALASKANTSDVTTSLALKANTADVTTSLATKANASDVTTSLALKANTADVTTALATKANTTDVTTSLSGKVDKVTGKELSTNDYTTPEKNKLAAITGTNTGDQTTITGNAGTATKLALPKNINGVAFDGSADITVPSSAGTLTGTTLNSTVTASSLTSVGTLVAGSVPYSLLSGNAPTWNQNTTGNAATATKLASPKNINGVAFDGSADISITSSADAGTLSGTTLNSTVTGSSLTSVGTLLNATINGKVIIGSTSETSSKAIVEINSTTQGFLPPRMTYAQRQAISSPPSGLMIYCTDCGNAEFTGEPQFFNGLSWSNMIGNPAKTSFFIGKSYQGGVIAYILQPNDPGYDASTPHGLIAATSDQSTGIQWENGTDQYTAANDTTLGTGFANTNAIITIQGETTTSYAAGLARAHTGGGYTDWYLPSKGELLKLFANKALIGGFSDTYYWSSSEILFVDPWTTPGQAGAYFVDFTTIPQFQRFYYTGKSSTYRVRAIRSF